MEPNEFITKIYEESIAIVGSDDVTKSDLDIKIKEFLDEVLKRSESAKAVVTVIITSAVYKAIYPDQDIRNHQISIKNGYSGRTFDAKYITPFLKSVQFPAMASSGWLTRSLEQKVPYDFSYSGAITPDSLKTAFLNVIDYINKGVNIDKVISYLFQGLIIQRNSHEINLAKPHNLQIDKIIALLTRHFGSKYSAEGVSRLPVLALYAVYQCLVDEVKRYEGKKLLPMESHTSADLRSGRIGDIDIVDNNDKAFEGVEVKFGIPITVQLVKDSFRKI